MTRAYQDMRLNIVNNCSSGKTLHFVQPCKHGFEDGRSSGQDHTMDSVLLAVTDLQKEVFHVINNNVYTEDLIFGTGQFVTHWSLVTSTDNVNETQLSNR